MEHSAFKSVTFGGFAKEDVIHYIEKTAQENAAIQENLQQENDTLREANAKLEEETASLRTQLENLQAELKVLQGASSREAAAQQALKASQQSVEQLTAQVEQLQPDAAAYAQFRERIGAIECEARKRAADLEDESQNRMEQAVKVFRTQYQELMRTFEATASHVNQELRKIEVNLTQLPRALDQSNADLKELETLLSPSAHAETKA